jgi:hypothetical protein
VANEPQFSLAAIMASQRRNPIRDHAQNPDAYSILKSNSGVIKRC